VQLSKETDFPIPSLVYGGGTGRGHHDVGMLQASTPTLPLKRRRE
jgi:hypothetical protein